MVNYWLCVTNETNWSIVREKKIWGIPKRYKWLIGRVGQGDFLVFYVSPKRITGIFKATSQPFQDEEKIFNSEGFDREVFPHRVRLEPVIIAKEAIPFDSLVPKLQFILSKKNWQGYLRRAMIAIPKEDYYLILDAIS